MIPTDFPVAFACGTISAAIQARHIRLKKPDLLTGRIAKVGTGAALWYALSVSYCFYKYPDWMYGYSTDSATTSPLLVFLVFAPCMALAGLCGAMLNQTLIERGRLSGAITVAVVSFALCMVSIVLVFKAFNHVGTFAEWCAGQAPSVDDEVNGPFRRMYVGIGAVHTVAALTLVYFLVRDAMRLGRSTPAA